ncbi:hypothetical protein TNCT_337971, partial [Trichonephila clavata]
DTNEGPSTTDNHLKEPCRRHVELETNVVEASAHLEYARQLLRYELHSRPIRDSDAITKHQTDVVDLIGLSH